MGRNSGTPNPRFNPNPTPSGGPQDIFAKISAEAKKAFATAPRPVVTLKSGAKSTFAVDYQPKVRRPR